MAKRPTGATPRDPGSDNGDGVRPEGHRPLPGSERPRAEGSVLIEPLNESERVAFTIRVRQPPGAPEEPGLDYWQIALGLDLDGRSGVLNRPKTGLISRSAGRRRPRPRAKGKLQRAQN
jgi:hypothetical protein